MTGNLKGLTFSHYALFTFSPPTFSITHRQQFNIVQTILLGPSFGEWGGGRGILIRSVVRDVLFLSSVCRRDPPKTRLRTRKITIHRPNPKPFDRFDVVTSCFTAEGSPRLALKRTPSTIGRARKFLILFRYNTITVRANHGLRCSADCQGY